MKHRNDSLLGRARHLLVAAALAAAPAACALDGDVASYERASTEQHDPVIFVHGCAPPIDDNQAESEFFSDMADYFRSRGYRDEDLAPFVLPGVNCPSNIDWALAIGDFVEQVRAATGARRVDIVAHSMGAVATRLYILEGGYRDVEHFASVAGVNHGSLVAAEFADFQLLVGYPAYEGAKELYPPYACDGESLGADVQPAINGCLTASGRRTDVDETPAEVGEGGQMKYLSIYNPLDEIVDPAESACLGQQRKNDCSDPRNVSITVAPGPLPAHIMILSDPAVMQRVYEFVAHE